MDSQRKPERNLSVKRFGGAVGWATTRSDDLSAARSSGPSSCLRRTRRNEATGGCGYPRVKLHSLWLEPHTRSGLCRHLES